MPPTPPRQWAILTGSPPAHRWDNDETVFFETPRPDLDLEFRFLQHICGLTSLQELHLQNLTFPAQGSALAALGQLDKLTQLRVARSAQSRAAGHLTHDQVGMSCFRTTGQNERL